MSSPQREAPCLPGVRTRPEFFSPLPFLFSNRNHHHLLHRQRRTSRMSNPQSATGSESEFEFIETPKAPTPTFEKFEECGVRTTSVGSFPVNSTKRMRDCCSQQSTVSIHQECTSTRRWRRFRELLVQGDRLSPPRRPLLPGLENRRWDQDDPLPRSFHHRPPASRLLDPCINHQPA